MTTILSVLQRKQQVSECVYTAQPVTELKKWTVGLSRLLWPVIQFKCNFRRNPRKTKIVIFSCKWNVTSKGGETGQHVCINIRINISKYFKINSDLSDMVSALKKLWKEGMPLFVTSSETLNKFTTEDYGMYPLFIKTNIKNYYWWLITCSLNIPK